MLYVGVGVIVCAWMSYMYVCVQVCVYVCVLRGFADTMAYILALKLTDNFAWVYTINLISNKTTHAIAIIHKIYGNKIKTWHKYAILTK